MESAMTEAYIARCIKSKSLVSVFLVNGVRLQGVILAKDELSILLTTSKAEGSEVSDDNTQLVARSTVSTITRQT